MPIPDHLAEEIQRVAVEYGVASHQAYTKQVADRLELLGDDVNAAELVAGTIPDVDTIALLFARSCLTLEPGYALEVRRNTNIEAAAWRITYIGPDEPDRHPEAETHDRTD
jgi:hypothetical protein